MNSITIARVGRKSPAQVARLVLGLFKLRIAVMIMITALVGLVVTPGPASSLAQVVVLALAVLLANIVIGGLAGSFAVLAGGAAVDPMLGPLPLLLALVLFLWGRRLFPAQGARAGPRAEPQDGDSVVLCIAGTAQLAARRCEHRWLDALRLRAAPHAAPACSARC